MAQYSFDELKEQAYVALNNENSSESEGISMFTKWIAPHTIPRIWT